MLTPYRRQYSRVCNWRASISSSSLFFRCLLCCLRIRRTRRYRAIAYISRNFVHRCILLPSAAIEYCAYLSPSAALPQGCLAFAIKGTQNRQVSFLTILYLYRARVTFVPTPRHLDFESISRRSCALRSYLMSQSSIAPRYGLFININCVF